MLVFTEIYRRLCCRKGYGVHSPFVFDLMTNVIEDPCAYYSYDDISRIRRELSQNPTFICYKGKQITVKRAIRKYGISKREGEFLFRLANYYKPRTILSVGSSLGLTPLYLTRYDSDVQCVTLESEPHFAEMATHLLSKETNPSLQIRTGAYHKLVPESLVQFTLIDCIFADKNVEISELDAIFNQCLPFIHDHTFCVMAGIRSSSEKYHFWKQICQHPKVTVAIDMFQMGLLFFQPKLHKRVYRTIIS